MAAKEQLKTGRIFYASPWIFAAACALLTLIIGVFAANNYQREKKLMSQALFQEGRAVLNLVSAGARAAVRRAILTNNFAPDSWIIAVQTVIEDSSQHPSIALLSMIDAKGKVLAHSDFTLVGQITDTQTMRLVENFGHEKLPPQSQIKRERIDGKDVFQIIKTYHPMRANDGMAQRMRRMSPGNIGRMMRDSELSLAQKRILDELSQNQYYLIAELEMTEFQALVRKQFVQIVILSIILLLVGTGGLLSLMTLQGYRGSQRRLRRISAFTDILVSSLPIGLIATDVDGTIRTCNKSACEMLGLIQERALGQAPRNILPKDLLENMSHGNQKDEQLHREVTVIDGAGNEKSLHSTLLYFGDKEHQHGMMLLIQDLSQLKELETELRRSERHAALGKMAAGLAHELRNPLSSIKGLALLLKATSPKDAIDQAKADLLVDEVERLNRSISELLEYSRSARLNKQNIELPNLIEKALHLVHSDLKAANITISHQFPDTSHTATADQDKLIQVLLNLFLNSIQAMPNGGHLAIRMWDDTNSVYIEISDTGTGIEPSIRDQVFDPYFTTKLEGTGLGLSLSAKIIEDHLGSLSIDSSNESGTVVTIRLPLH
ncbi:MAG: PAS domain S-box protein [Deltaproteobacteria bacterium]|nr:PAS domain S-box protein [Deltaproteobacteria bacterium]